MTSKNRNRWVFSGLLALLMAACGGGGGGDAGGGQDGEAAAAVAAITISVSTTSINPGQAATFTAYPVDAQGNVLSGVALAWQSSNTAVVTVAAGVATPVAAGSASISASANGITSNVVALSVTASTVPPGTPAAPVNSALPTVTVTDRESFLTLAASTGTWSNGPTAYAYGWIRNGSAIPGATLASYDTTTLDRGASVAAVVTGSNSAGGATATSAVVNVPTAMTADPKLGAHGMAFHRSNGSVGARLFTPAMATQATGSTMLAFVGKGSVFNLGLPSDNKGNSPYFQVGTIHEYTRWPGEGTAVYAFNSMVGGANHLVSIDDSNTFDEVTFATVEVRNGGVIQDNQWNEVLNSPTQASKSVTTTGPATLVAVWFGDDASSTPSVPIPNNGFTVIESNGQAVESVQMTVATKNVPVAGTYTVTWTATPRQGAQLYLIAVQKR
jgi:hypothetical protein